MKAGSLSRLHNSVSLAIAICRTDNDGALPPDLAVLVQHGYLEDPSALLDPADDDPQPIPGSGFRSSYEYVGVELPSDLLASCIIAYSRRGVHPDGRAVLYVDGEVDFVTEEELQRPGGLRGMSMPEQCAWIEDRYGVEVTAEERTRLRKFYDAGPGVGDMFEDDNSNNVWDPGEKIIWANP
jgi:hypothetical protein